MRGDGIVFSAAVFSLVKFGRTRVFAVPENESPRHWFVILPDDPKFQATVILLYYPWIGMYVSDFFAIRGIPMTSDKPMSDFVAGFLSSFSSYK